MNQPSPHSDSAQPLNRDLHCLACGYNLPRLAGDPVCCPECGNLNVIHDIEVPANAIRRQIRKMEINPATCLLMLLLVAIFQPIFWALVWERVHTGQLFEGVCDGVVAVLAFGSILGWIYSARQFGVSCLGKQGWLRALIAYHLWGLFLMATTIGAPLLLLILCLETGCHIRSIPRGTPVLVWVMLLIVGFTGIVYWVRWVYRRATEPFMQLQREVAVTIARREIEKKMTRKLRRYQ